MEFFPSVQAYYCGKKVIYGIIIDRGNNYEKEDKGRLQEFEQRNTQNDLEEFREERKKAQKEKKS